eukprot:COSAG02_NODE_148_length_33809_cov_158.369594_29_plen_39_part_00
MIQLVLTFLRFLCTSSERTSNFNALGVAVGAVVSTWFI